MTVNFSTTGQLAQHVAVIQRLVRKAHDEDEDDQDVWADMCKARGSFPPQTSGIANNMDRLENYQMITRNIQYFEMQHPRFQIDPNRMRLAINGEIYNIRGAEDIGGMGQMLRLVVIKKT